MPSLSDSPVREFAVDDVSPATSPIWTEAFARNLGRRLERRILALPDPERPVVNIVANEYPPAWRVYTPRPGDPEFNPVSRVHPLVDAIHTAFLEHRPLCLSPDAIWLAIAQGFSHHLAENAERFRGRLVRHLGQVELTEQLTDLTLASFQSAIAGFSTQIRAASDPVLYETLICEFSTTTPEARTASEVVLLDTYSSYFTYVATFVCGIPTITVTGSVQDWERIRARVEVLATYDLEWWVARLRPILDEFVQTSTGTVNLDFWKAIYKPKEEYATNRVTGWLADLFPYLGDSPDRKRNQVFEYPRQNWALPVENGLEMLPTRISFPSGLSRAPLKIELLDQRTTNCNLVAGFMALDQNTETLSLSPHISWAVVEPPPAEPIPISKF